MTTESTTTRRWEAYVDGETEIFTAESHDQARDAAEGWIQDGDWVADNTTSWVRWTMTEIDDDGADIDGTEESHRTEIDPPEPNCEPVGDDHDWSSAFDLVGGIKENPGVWGSGGGVKIHEGCTTCGLGKITDTWAQDPETGEQGLTSITYPPYAYDVSDRCAECEDWAPDPVRCSVDGCDLLLCPPCWRADDTWWIDPPTCPACSAELEESS